MQKRSVIAAITTALAIFALTFGLAACGGKKAGYEQVENSMKIAKANAQFVAKSFISEKHPGYSVYVEGDSSITPDCVRGDGWSTVQFISPDGKEKIKGKCSTYSVGKGCYDQVDFDKKPFASEDKSCNKDIPDPLPTLVQ